MTGLDLGSCFGLKKHAFTEIQHEKLHVAPKFPLFTLLKSIILAKTILFWN